jgi:hypothetical protein
MNLLPWKNPLVVTSFLLRARRGGFFTVTTLYILILAMGYGVWQYYVQTYPQAKSIISPDLKAFLFLYCGQCVLSGIAMMQSAGNAIKVEVLNKTLDFQRIAAVSPWDILIGKLLGPPTLAYLLAIAAFPMGFFCMLSGVPGLDVLSLVLLWIELLCFLFLLGSSAIQHSLQSTVGRRGGASVSFGMMSGFMVMITISLFSGGDVFSFLANPLRVSLPALICPLPAITGVFVGDPWAAKFYFFSIPIPVLLFSPVAHLALAWFILNIMARRLENTENTPLSKRLSYLFIIVADLLLVGILQSGGKAGPLGAAGVTLRIQVAIFLCIHIILSFVAVGAVTPKKETLLSWVWRFRGLRSAFVDALLHDRTPNLLPILVSIVSGLGGLCLLIATWNSAGVPAGPGPAPSGIGFWLQMLATGNGAVTPEFLLQATALAAATIFFWGLLFQWFLLVSSKYGPSFFFLVMILSTGVPMMAGMILANTAGGPHPLATLFLHLTPIAQVPLWLSESAPNWLKSVSPLPVTIGYTLLGIGLLFAVYGRVNSMVQRVERTKGGIEIGLLPTTA